MTYRSADLTAELRGIAGTDPPPLSRLDLDDVRSRGLALRRRRRAAGIGSACVATGVAAALLLTFLPYDARAERPAPAAALPFSLHDPLTSKITFGWLPHGMHLSGVTIDNEAVASDGVHEFAVVALDAGQLPPQECTGDPTAPTRCPVAPAVNGHAAYWSSGSDLDADGYAELEWQYAPNSWAYLDGNIGEAASPDNVETVLQVARNIRFGPARPSPLPFHIPSLPKGLKIIEESWQDEPTAPRGPDPSSTWIGADLGYTTLDESSTLDFYTAAAATTFPTDRELKFGDTSFPAKEIQSITIDGHQAIVIQGTERQLPVAILVVHDVGGADFTLTAINTVVGDLNARGGIVAFFRTMQVLGADPSNWTTDVVG